MRPRTALIASVALAMTATTPALAAKRPPVVKLCNLMTDDKGDGKWYGLQSDAIDILGGDIATGPTEVVAVLRVGNTDTKNDTVANLGFWWKFGASANGIRYEFDYRRGLGPNPDEHWGASVGGVAVGNVEFKVLDKNTFMWRYKRAGIAPLARPKLVWGDWGANSNVLSTSADTAKSERKYPDRAPTCITPAPK